MYKSRLCASSPPAQSGDGATQPVRRSVLCGHRAEGAKRGMSDKADVMTQSRLCASWPLNAFGVIRPEGFGLPPDKGPVGGFVASTEGVKPILHATCEFLAEDDQRTAAAFRYAITMPDGKVRSAAGGSASWRRSRTRRRSGGSSATWGCRRRSRRRCPRDHRPGASRRRSTESASRVPDAPREVAGREGRAVVVRPGHRIWACRGRGRCLAGDVLARCPLTAALYAAYCAGALAESSHARDVR